MTLGDKLKEARKNKGLSMRQTANLLGYRSHSIIQKWENGTRIPKYNNLLRLAKIYEIDLNILLK